MNDCQLLNEITPLMERDALYIADRRKKEFSYPMHIHDVYELNFVENGAGVRRIVGDNSEVIGDYDLVLITSPNLEHVWEQNECESEEIREITVQFKFGMGDESKDDFFAKNPFSNIRHMMKRAQSGLAFPMETIMKIYDKLDSLSQIQDRFTTIIQFLNILNTLAKSDGAYTLATSSFAKVKIVDDSRRVLKVKKYIQDHYMEDIKLNDLAGIANMSDSAFSRFFKLHTGRTLSDYLIDIRMGYATRLLVDTNKSISEISFCCGYNNMSNFNRLFKRKKGCSPSQFREDYKKVKIII